jgi:4-alpha-glucanotransferase
MSRHTGLMAPLFSVWSGRNWGIGTLPDLVPLGSWAASAGFDRLMILPLGPLPDGITSPFSAMSSMAFDPNYIAFDRVEDFAQAGGAEALSPDRRRDLDAARRSPRVRYDLVRQVQGEALDRAFAWFFDAEWSDRTMRGASLAGYIARERWWLDDFSLYLSLETETGRPLWQDWPAPLRDREPAAIDAARRRLWRQMLKHQYAQWLAESQWQTARRALRTMGVTVFGDLPFAVSLNSPELWVRPTEYRFDVSLGVPPDAFSDTGQDWHVPAYDWGAIAATDYAWMKLRARRMAALYDGYRVDHLVGLYRTYGRPLRGQPFFNPATEPEQIRQGERLLGILGASGAALIVEDLGLIPDFVRESLARLGVPGSKVLRWERRWKEPGQPFIMPADYPQVSAAMTGTHDTDPVAEWWDAAIADERQALAAMLRSAGHPIAAASPWSAGVRDAILAAIYEAGSRELFLPIQDVFGWRDRINLPGAVSDENWTWRLPWPIERWADEPEAVACASRCAAFARMRKDQKC